MNRIVQTGDIHVGECRSLAGYLARHKSVLDLITLHAQLKKAPLIVAGDIFHTKTVSNEEKFLVDYWFSCLEKNKIFTIVITGNHDHLYGDVTHLDGYAHFPWKYVNIVPQRPKCLLNDGVGFICIPWGGYSQEQLSEIVHNYRDYVSGCRFVVVVCHECLLGSVFDNGTVSKKGLKLPDIPWVDYWAVGDIHKAQNAGLVNAFYAGSPLQFNFNDSVEKGILEIDLSDPCRPVPVEINSKKLVVVNNTKDIIDDGSSFYMVRANDSEDLINSHKYSSVIKTNWVATENKETISLENDDIFVGLSDFLREKGFSDEDIAYAKDIVKSLKG